MVDLASPLSITPGSYNLRGSAPGVVLSESRPSAIVQVGAFAGFETAVLASIAKATGVKLANVPGAGAATNKLNIFAIAPARWLVADAGEGMAGRLAKAVSKDEGAVTRLTHGRTVLRVEGPQAVWVLSKLFAVDFAAMPLHAGLSTSHHDVFAQIQRSGEQAFDLYVFRSFARSFWHALRAAAEETGYEVR